MTLTIIRCAWRQSLTLFFLPVWVLIYALEVVDRDATWRSDWMRTIDTAGSTLDLLGPLLAACVAVDVIRHTTGSSAERQFVRSQPERGYLLIWAIPTIAAVLLHLVVVALMLYESTRWGAVYRGGETFVLAQALGLGVYGGLGLVVSRALRARIAPIVAFGAATLAVFQFNGLGEHERLLAFGGATLPLFGLRWVSGYHVEHAASLLVVLLLMQLPAPSRIRSINSIVDGWGVARLVAALLSASVLALFGSTDYYRSVPIEQGGSVCMQSRVEVCVFEEHRAYLDPLVTALESAYQSLARSGVDRSALPSRYVEHGHRDGPPTVSEVEFRLDVTVDRSSDAVLAPLLEALTFVPINCKQVWAAEPPSDEITVAVAALRSYVAPRVIRPNTPAATDFLAEDTLRGLSAQQQAHLVNRIWAAFKACDLDGPLHLPPSVVRDHFGFS